MDASLTNSLAALDQRHHLHSQSNPQSLAQDGPMMVVRGDGAYVTDEGGMRYVDAMAGLWCASLGFSNKRLIAAAARQYAELPFYHTFYNRSNAPAARLSARLTELAGMTDGRVWFGCSGSEANETMVKLAWLYHAARGKPTKRKIIARDRGFHGSTIVAASMCGLEMMHREYGLPMPGFIHTLCPHPYRGMLTGESEADFTARLARELENLILREGPDSIAAFIAEPVIAGGGIIPPPAGYFPAIQAVLAKYDILMLDDEVVCGFGRTGQWFGKDRFGMRTHMMSLAKGTTSSYFPLSAVVMAPEIHQAVEAANASGTSFGHGITNSGHPVGCAVSLEAMDIYEEMDVTAHVRRMGPLLEAGLRRAAEGSSIVGNIRWVGLMWGVELVEDPQTGSPFAPARGIGAAFQAAAYRNGLVVRAMRDTVGFCPPLIVDAPVIDDIVARFTTTLRDIETWARAA
jgi:4-aminobutyrate--pyruvate transaminase